MRRIMHVDMDQFFAAIELQRHPELVGRPVIVGGRGDPAARGVVATASYEARRFGVHSGMPLRTAWRRCPQAVFLPVDFPAYAAVSGRIKSVLREITPLLEDAGLDEAFLDVSDDPRPSEEIARLVKDRIRAQTKLTCSIGIGPNRLLAKIASDMRKPDGLTVLTEADVESRVWALPVRKLWGVGPKTEAKLRALGVATIGDLARTSAERLAETFGPAHGDDLAAAARGRDESPVITHWEPKSMSRETTFQRDIWDLRRLERTIARLADELAAELRAEGYVARQVTVKLRSADFDTHAHGVTLARAVDDPETIREAAKAALRRFALVKKVRLIGIRAGALARPGSAGTALATVERPRSPAAGKPGHR